MAYFGDGQFTVRIDRMRNGEIRYLCWRKINSILAKPNLILRHGKVKETLNGEVTKFIFRHNQSIFTVEHIVSKMKGGANYFFIEVTDKDQKKSTWKMSPIPIPKYFR